MSGWALASPGFTVLDRFDLATTDLKSTTVTASGTANTKGSWVELDASTSQDAHMIRVLLQNTYTSGTNTGVLVDIGVGAAASETVLISNLLGGWKSTAGVTAVPIFIPAGTRLSARCQAVIVSDTIDVGVDLYTTPNSFDHDMRQFGNVVTYGADTTNSRGTIVSGPGSADTKGSWTQITASTTEPHSALVMSVAGHTDTSLATQFIFVDVGFGAAAAEKVLLKDVWLRMSSSEIVYVDDYNAGNLGFGRILPVGTRLAVRLQAGGNTNDVISLCLHGVT